MSGLNGSLDGIIEDLKRLHWAAENRVSEAQAVLDQAKAERDHIVRMLKVGGVELEKETKPQRKAKRETAPKSMGEETRVKVWAAIHAHIERARPVLTDVPDSFTIRDLEELTDLHSSSLRNGIEILRQEGSLRAVGTVANGAPRPPMAFAPVRAYVPPATGDE